MIEPIEIERFLGSVLDYQVDLSAQDFLASQNLASATVTAIDSGLTIGSPTVSGDVVTFRISGGTISSGYRTRHRLLLLATAADGQKHEHPIEVISYTRQ